MPKKPNYNFEKRQKELARDQKKETKLREKRERKEAERAVRDSESATPSIPPSSNGEPTA